MNHRQYINRGYFSLPTKLDERISFLQQWFPDADAAIIHTISLNNLIKYTVRQPNFIHHYLEKIGSEYKIKSKNISSSTMFLHTIIRHADYDAYVLYSIEGYRSLDKNSTGVVRGAYIKDYDENLKRIRDEKVDILLG